jgi:hypothetical protein
MKYLILLLVIIFCSAVMDTTDYIANFLKRKGYQKLFEWFNSNSWKNKWRLAEWLEKIGLSKSLSKWLAADVLVIFTDGWHFFKAIMMALVQYMVAVLSIGDVNSFLIFINFPITNISVEVLAFILFLVGGQIFNLIFYRFRRL